MRLLQGEIEWFNDNKGFGFVRSKQVTGPVMLHYSALNIVGRASVQAGEEVFFTARKARNGLRVEEVFFSSDLELQIEIRTFLSRVSGVIEPLSYPRFAEALERSFFAQSYGLEVGLEVADHYLQRFGLDSIKDNISGAVLWRFLELEKDLIEKKNECLKACESLFVIDAEMGRSLHASVISFDRERTKMEALKHFDFITRACTDRLLSSI